MVVTSYVSIDERKLYQENNDREKECITGRRRPDNNTTKKEEKEIAKTIVFLNFT